MTPELMKMFKKCESDYKKAHSPSTYNYSSSGSSYIYKNGQLILLNNKNKKALENATKALMGLK